MTDSQTTGHDPPARPMTGDHHFSPGGACDDLSPGRAGGDLSPGGVGGGFNSLYERHFALVWRALGYFGVPPESREDVAQDVWVVVYRKLQTLEAPEKAPPWLWAIARRVASDYRRSRSRASRGLESLAATVSSASPRGMEPVEARRTIEEVLTSLPVDQQMTMVLTCVEGMTGPEVAETMGISVNTVYSRLRLAREHIDRTIAEAARGEDAADEKVRARCLAGVLAVVMPAGVSAPPEVAIPMTPMGAPASQPAVMAASKGVAQLWKLPAAIAAMTAVVAVGVGFSSHDREPQSVSMSRGAEHRHDRDELVAAEASELFEPEAEAKLGSQAEVEITEMSTKRPASVAVPLDTVAEETVAAQTTRASRTTSESAAAHPPPEHRDDASAAKPSSLERELALLTPAADALRRGEPQQAITLLSEHLRRFPDSELWDLRESTWIRALCHLGDSASAQERITDALQRNSDAKSIRAARSWCATLPNVTDLKHERGTDHDEDISS